MARSRAESARGGSQEPHCDSRTQSARIFLPMTAERGPACKSYSASVQPQGGMPFERTQPAPRPFARRLLGARLAERHVATVQVDPASRACLLNGTYAAQGGDHHGGAGLRREHAAGRAGRGAAEADGDCIAALVNARADGADQPNHGEYKLQIEFARTCILNWDMAL